MQDYKTILKYLSESKSQRFIASVLRISRNTVSDVAVTAAGILLDYEKAKDLKREGKELDHCVGNMGYDNKMINGVSFIAFVRKCEEIEKPYVTVEYGLKDNKVLQCYGYHDSKPQQEVIDFVDEWGKKVKKEMMAQ